MLLYCSGEAVRDRADPPGLCSQRRLGDLPQLRGSRAGHPGGTSQAQEAL